ncbi:MAG: NUDIX hydrolase [Rhodobacteraceae bacterium]|nr:NUDIX hydrolase [Paracoccaceae bacterium]MBA84740.1 NUDIX hydrolase [Paracoccaceae bacterium]MBA86346.1 NUDIX hydrolase [Paracoccaceae bacterium]MBT26905.1 NUDIX hydrolase [Paracoccaceae bacterium]
MSWKILKDETVFEHAPFLRIRKEQVEVRPGQIIDDFYKIDLRPFALIIPFLENGKVLVIRQYKHGPGAEMLGFPAGYVDPGEPADLTATRELMEETGLQTGQLIPMGAYVDNGNQTGSTGHYFAATGCRRVADPAPGDLEDFAYEEMTPAEINVAMKAGQFSVIHHVAAWGLWGLYRP